MTKSLLQQVMLKANKKSTIIDSDALVEKIKSGYVVNRGPKFQTKKTFAPSTIAYSHGECPRYWYLAFDGAVFEDNADAYGAANMTAGTLSHGRIQDAMMNSGVAKIYRDDDNNPTTEFKVRYDDPPIFGYGDVMLDWEGEALLGEIKTMMNEGFEYRKINRKPKPGHLIQLLIYMKILQKKKAVLIYENKNNHELLVLPVEINDYYIKWVNQTFEWMRTVRKAWENKTLPEKNYRSNSKICKNCPLSKVCADAGKGDIKIDRLEPIEENMSMV
jgi:CRISPR/Cas system-associated exonuclease Cas4 (RecB family)